MRSRVLNDSASPLYYRTAASKYTSSNSSRAITFTFGLIMLEKVWAPLLLYGCTTWMQTKRMEKKLDGNYTRMLRAILNESWRQHPHKAAAIRPPTSHHCWRIRDELISDVLQWTPSHGRAEARWPARTYIQQLCEDTGCSPEDLPKVIGRSGERWSGISV